MIKAEYSRLYVLLQRPSAVSADQCLCLMLPARPSVSAVCPHRHTADPTRTRRMTLGLWSSVLQTDITQTSSTVY